MKNRKNNFATIYTEASSLLILQFCLFSKEDGSFRTSCARLREVISRWPATLSR